MLNLLRADLYRITRVRGLRGTLVAYAVYLVIAVVLVTATLWIALAGTTPGVGSMSVRFSEMPLSGGIAAELLRLNLLPLMSSFGMIGIVFDERNQGFAQTIGAGIRGRLAPLAAKFLLAGIWTLAICLLAFASILLYNLLLAFTPGISLDAPGPFLLWFGELWLIGWAYASIALMAGEVTRRRSTTLLLAFLLSAGALSGAITGVAELLSVSGETGATVGQALMTFLSWGPTAATGFLSYGAEAFLISAPIARVAAIGVLWILLSAGIALAVRYRRGNV